MYSAVVRVSTTLDVLVRSIPMAMSSDRQMSGFMVVRLERMKVWLRVMETCSAAVISVSFIVLSNILTAA